MTLNKVNLKLLDTTGATDGQAIVYSSATGSLSYSTVSGGGGVTSYDTVGDLPSSGNSVGDQAYVVATNSLYLWGASNAWFVISTQDSAPTAISNIYSQYTLSTSGSNLTLVPSSSDPEGVPLTWGYEVVSGTLGNTVITVDQDVYNIQPSTDIGDDGTFILRIFANDGVLTSNARVTFDLPLTSGWNVSSAVATRYQNLYYSVASQEANPWSLTFNTSGDKMYIVGSTGDDINEYSLSTAYNLDTAVFSSAYVVSSNTTATNILNPSGIRFSADGSNVYIIGTTVDALNEAHIAQFTLGTAWGLSTLTPPPDSWRSLSVNTQETGPSSVTTSADGTKLFIVGTAGDDINEYTMSPAWNPSDAVFIGSTALTGETAPNAHYWSPDGANVYVVGQSTDTVRQYSLSTPWTVSTLNSTAIATFSVGSQETVPTGLYFKPDGTRMYVIGQSGDDVNEYSLSTAWDLSTASYTTTSASLSAQASQPQTLRFSSDGTKLFTTGTNFDINVYTLSTAWDISTISFEYVWKPLRGGGNLTGIHFSDDGYYLYMTETTYDRVWTFKLRTAWDLNTAIIPQRFFDSANFTGSVGTVGFDFNSDGSKLYTQSESEDAITEYTLSESWNINAITSVASFNTAPYSSAARSVFVSPDDSNVYITSDYAIHRFNMSESSNIQTAYADQVFIGGSNLTLVSDMYISPSGNTLFAATRGGTAYQLDMSTDYDVNTMNWNGASLSINSLENGQFNGLVLNDSGDKLWVIGTNNFKLFEYDLSTAWDLSTASYSNRYYIPKWPAAPSTVYSPRFYNSGYSFYIILNNTILCQYTLSTPYDLGSVTDSKFINLTGATGVTVFTSIDFVNSGYTIIVGSGDGFLYSCDLPTAYDVSSITLESYFYRLPSLVPLSSGSSGWARTITPDGLYIFSGVREGLGIITRYEMTEPGRIYTARHPTVIYPAVSPYPLSESYITDNTIYSVNTGYDAVYAFPINRLANNITALSTAQLESPELSSYISSIGSINFKPDGTKFYMLDTSNDLIFEYSLSTAWDVHSSLTLLNTFKISYTGAENTPNGLDISADGKYFYVIGSTRQVILQLETATPWSIANLTVVREFSVAAQETNPQAVQFDTTGTKMFVVGLTGDDINYYSLSTAWDISTASYVTATSSLASVVSNPASFKFSDDGSRVYVRGGTANKIAEYSLSTPWDITTISYTRDITLSSQFTGYGGFALKPGGKKLYVGDPTNSYARVIEFDLGN